MLQPAGSFQLKFQETDVFFPYKPYESQNLMMDGIMRGMNSCQNCLLESPAGTGKTAALLCASIAWLKNEMRENPQSKVIIIYASRTHSQLEQIADEVKKTPYRDIPTVILSSRNQTSSHRGALNATRTDEMCKAMTSNQSDTEEKRYLKVGCCGSRNAHKLFQENPPKSQANLNETYHYYGINTVQANAKLVLCNYNHVLHPGIRKAVNLEVEGNIVIFDEAHNVESACMDIGSRNISMNFIQHTIIPALEVAKGKPDMPEGKIKALKNVEGAFRKLCNWLISQGGWKNKHEFKLLGDNLLAKKIKDPLKELSSVGFSAEKVKALRDDVLTLKGENCGQPGNCEIAEAKVDGRAMSSVSSIVFFLHELFQEDSAGHKHSIFESFSMDVIIRRISDLQPYSDTELSLICLSPKIIFKHMEPARSIIFASSTLPPSLSFSSELGITCQHEVSAHPVLGKDRIFARVISHHGKNNFRFNFNYDTLQSKGELSQQAEALGNLLLELCQKIPNGILVFFPSKSLIESLKTKWEKNKTLERLSEFKRPFFEHEIAQKIFKETMEEYRRSAMATGAITFAVFRGRISEGIDFADGQARAVITVGIPFASLNDLKIKRKRELHDYRKCGGYTSGWNWYMSNAFRALNQGLGRCLRHEDDWGAIFMVDSRYTNYQDRITGWVRDSINPNWEGKVEQIQEQLDQFLSKLNRPEKDDTVRTPVKRLKVSEF